MAIFIHLQSKCVVQARELAQRFDVSIRTIYRDMRSLENAGIPIAAETGKGYFLVEGYHLPPVMFTPQEIGALLLAERTAGLFTDPASQASLVSALTKIKAVLKDAQKDWASAVEEQMSAYNPQAMDTPQTNRFIQDLQNALYEKKTLEIRYRSLKSDQSTQRKIEPVHMYFAGMYWYVVAFCHLRDAYRIFRVDQIEDLQPTDLNFTHTHPPIDEILRTMLESKAGHCVILRFPDKLAWEAFRNHLLPGCILKTENNEARVEVTLLVDSLQVIGKWLVESGCEYEIEQPDELKAAARQYALEMADAYKRRAKALE
jgi:predicted DNA-binding transcriptional regulator YafY